MNWHLAATSLNATAVTNNEAMIAVADDGVLRVVNSNFESTDHLWIRAWFGHSASMTRQRLSSASFATPARPHLWPIHRSATIPSDPRALDLRRTPWAWPLNEELQVQHSNDLAMGNERANALLWLTPPGWSGGLPEFRKIRANGLSELVVRATATIVVTANAWSAAVELTLEEEIQAGWYALLNSHEFGASHIAHRFVFRNQRSGSKRLWRPGFLCQEAQGNQPDILQREPPFGVLGYFANREPPAIQVMALAAGATAVNLRLHLGYLGEQAPGILM